MISEVVSFFEKIQVAIIKEQARAELLQFFKINHPTTLAYSHPRCVIPRHGDEKRERERRVATIDTHAQGESQTDGRLPKFCCSKMSALCYVSIFDENESSIVPPTNVCSNLSYARVKRQKYWLIKLLFITRLWF